MSSKISNLNKSTLMKVLGEGKRFDGRGLLDFREIVVEGEVSNKAEGSIRLKVGKTDVVVGIKLSTGEPYPDSPDKGNLIVSSEFLPLASPGFESGPPGFNSIELARLIDRMVRESKMIELEKLCIKEGERVWNVFIDIYPINHDGNLIDAAGLAVLIALKNTVMPGLKENNTADYEKRTKEKLHLSKEILPITFSFFKIGNSLFMDPTREEEEATDARITWGISKWKGQYVLNSCQKAGEVPFTPEEIEKMMEILPKKYEEISKEMGKYIK